nr:MAG TPA: hypothetical protein [Bacteriophage sp.]
MGRLIFITNYISSREYININLSLSQMQKQKGENLYDTRKRNTKISQGNRK